MYEYVCLCICVRKMCKLELTPVYTCINCIYVQFTHVLSSIVKQDLSDLGASS